MYQSYTQEPKCKARDIKEETQERIKRERERRRREGRRKAVR